MGDTLQVPKIDNTCPSTLLPTKHTLILLNWKEKKNVKKEFEKYGHPIKLVNAHHIFSKKPRLPFHLFRYITFGGLRGNISSLENVPNVVSDYN